MSKVPKTPNQDQPGRIFEEHLRDGIKVGEPPLSPDERRRRVVQLAISGPSGSTSPWPISSTCRTKIVARLAGALNAQLAAAEARRAEQAPGPDSMGSLFSREGLAQEGLDP